MSKKYIKLTREAMKALTPGQSICENNIHYTKLKDGDGLFSIYLTVNGQRIHRNVGKESEGVTRHKVEEVLEQAKADARADRFNLPKARKNHMGFREAAKNYIDRLDVEGGKWINRKQQMLSKRLIPFFRDTPLNKLETFEVERYKKQRLDQGAANGTINRELCTLSHLINKSMEWGWLAHKPCLIKKLREEQQKNRYLTAEEIQRLLKAAREESNPMVYPFIKVALGTSMRRMEILSIKIENIDLDRRTIYIPKAKAGARNQPITRELAEYLRDYIVRCTQPEQTYLFPGTSKQGHYVTIERPFRKVVQAAGLDPYEVTRHTLRHTTITHLVQAGIDLPTVQRISGHKSLQMVQRYSHQNGEHIHAAMEKLEHRYQV